MSGNLREHHTRMVKSLSNTDYAKKKLVSWNRFVDCCSERKFFMECGCLLIENYYRHCRLQFCPMCESVKKVNRYKEVSHVLNLLQAEHAKNNPLNMFLITFTVKSGGGLSIQLEKVLKGLRKFKKNDFFQKFCYAGFQLINLARSKRKWDVCCNMIIISERNCVEKKELMKLKIYWEKITCDGSLANILPLEKVEDCKDIFTDGLKYEELSKKSLYELVVSVSGRRLYSKIGKAYNYSF